MQWVFLDISGNQFIKLSPFDGFGYLFPGYGKLMRKHMHFPCHEVYHKMESNGKKAPIVWETYEHQFRRFSPYDEFCCIFLYYGKLMGKPMYFPCDEVYYRMGIRWEKNTHTMVKVWVSVSQTFTIPWVLLHFPVLREIYGETHAFPIWWHRLIFSCAKESWTKTDAIVSNTYQI